MKTRYELYREGLTPFDWNKFLSKESYTDQELSVASKKAESWVTCAVGEQCSVIERYSGGSPKDPILQSLGIQFCGAILNMLFEDEREHARRLAQHILNRIEIRSSQLIKSYTNE